MIGAQMEAQNQKLLNDKKTGETRREREKGGAERELSKVKSELEVVRGEKEQIDKEFSTYKTRVHTVLKQQKQQKTDPNQLEQVCDQFCSSKHLKCFLRQKMHFFKRTIK